MEWKYGRKAASTTDAVTPSACGTSLSPRLTWRPYVYFNFHLLSRWFLARLILRPWRWRGTCSFETSVDFQQTTRGYIPEDRTLLYYTILNIRTILIKKNDVFRAATCSSVIDRRFGATYCLFIEGVKVRQVRSQQDVGSSCCLRVSGRVLEFLFDPDDGNRSILWNSAT
jgi:hypothetical protein